MNKLKFVIAIDAGATKTLGVIKKIDSASCFNKKVGAASLSYDLELACERICQLANDLIEMVGASKENSVIVCGAAGAANEECAQVLFNRLGNQYGERVITSDARTSLYGAGAGQPIIVIAIGTGSVAMKLDDNGLEQMKGGWGFVAGDLGSGAEIGRQLISRSLVEFDKKELSKDPILKILTNIIGEERQSILDWLSHANAASYASLAPLAFHQMESSPIAQFVVKQACASIEELIDCYSEEQLPVAIIGGLAEQFKKHLSPRIRSRLIAAKGSAVDGALYLGQQIIEEKEECLIQN